MHFQIIASLLTRSIGKIGKYGVKLAALHKATVHGLSYDMLWNGSDEQLFSDFVVNTDVS